MNVELTNKDIKEIVMETIQKVLQAAQFQFIVSGWLSLKDDAKYAGVVSYNTYRKFRVMGLQVCEIEGIKRYHVRRLIVSYNIIVFNQICMGIYHYVRL